MKDRFILHLASWYPNRLFPFQGDFVQRHIQCVQEQGRHVVLHTQRDCSRRFGTKELIIDDEDNLTTYTIYYHPIFYWLSPITGFIAGLHGYKQIKKEYGKPDLCHVHVMLYAVLLGYYLNKKYKIPYVITEHSTIYGNQSSNRTFSITSFIARLGMGKAKHIISVSDNLGHTLGRLNSNTIKTCTINNVVAPFFKYKVRQPGDIVNFLHVSTLNDDQKNIRGMLRAFDELRILRQDFRLTCIGMVDQHGTRGIIEEVIGDQNWVKINGPWSHNEVAQEMQRHDVFVLFSRYENMPCVLLEALASGLYCIATDVGGITEVINNNNGRLVINEDEGDLLAKLIESFHVLPNTSPEFISQLAHHKYGQKAIAAEILEVYDQVS